MAHKIIIDGVIGWDTTNESVRSQLKKANGEDIEIDISSPGGSVYEGISIFNQIREYKGKKETRIIGLAASMASYIALATPKVSVADNAIFMIHNAWSIALGDHNEMRKAADELEGLSNILSKAYSKKTGKSVDDIKSMMDSETFIYGEDISETGFADNVIQMESEDSREDSFAFAKLQIQDRDEKMAQLDKKTDLNKAAALFKQPKAQVAVIKKQQEETMTPEEIEAMKAEAFAKGAESVKVVEEPAAKEEVSVNALALSVLKSDSCMPQVKDIAAQVIEGTVEVGILKAVIAMDDMYNAKAKVEAAAVETKETGNTPTAQDEEDKNSPTAKFKASVEAGKNALGATGEVQ